MKKMAKKTPMKDADRKMEGMEKKMGKESRAEEKKEKHDPIMHGYTKED